MDEMWIGYTIDKSFLTSYGGYWVKNGIVSYYGGRETKIGDQY